MGIAVAQDVASNMTTPTLYDQYGSLALDNFQPIASQHATTIILAPCVAGWLSSIFLSGYALSYSIAYLTSPLRSEPKRIQALLVTVVLLVIANAAVHGVEIAHYLISQRRSFEDFQIFHWSDAIAPLPQALCQGLVQFLLAVRALSLVRSKHWRIALGAFIHSITLLAVLFAILTVVGGFMYMYGTTDPLDPIGVSLAGAAWYILASLVDLTILALLLIQFRRRLADSSPSPSLNNPHTRAEFVFKRLMRLSLGTWATTAFLTCGTAVSAIVTRNNLYYDLPVAFGAPLAPLYALSLFITLHAREGLRDLLRHDPHHSIRFSGGPVIHTTLPFESPKRFNVPAGGLQTRRPSHLSRASNSTIGTTILDAQGFPLGMGSEQRSMRRTSIPRLPSCSGIGGGITVVQEVTVEPWRPHLAPSEDELNERSPPPTTYEPNTG